MSPLTLNSGKPKFQAPPGLEQGSGAARSVGIVVGAGSEDNPEIVANQEGFHQEGPERLYGSQTPYRSLPK